MESLSRLEMIGMLHELDRSLTSPIRITICGGSAGILNHGLARRSMDIDVLSSSCPLDGADVQLAIHRVAEAHHCADRWINAEAEAVYNYLPRSYLPDTEVIQGEVFRLLQPGVVSKADLIITKLAMHDMIRPRDVTDIRGLALDEGDVAQLGRKLLDVAMADQSVSLIIESHFKEFRPEYACDPHGFRLTGAQDIACYVRERYGLDTTDLEVFNWRDSLDSYSARAETIVARIDRAMAERIREGDTRVAASDMAYRRRQGAPNGTP